MMEVEPAPLDFSSCDRTGRRNAVPDIKGDGGAGGTSEFGKDTAQMETQAADGQACAGRESSAVSHSPEVQGSGSEETHAGDSPS